MKTVETNLLFGNRSSCFDLFELFRGDFVARSALSSGFGRGVKPGRVPLEES